jgi:hypothetical protein
MKTRAAARKLRDQDLNAHFNEGGTSGGKQNVTKGQKTDRKKEYLREQVRYDERNRRKGVDEESRRRNAFLSGCCYFALEGQEIYYKKFLPERFPESADIWFQSADMKVSDYDPSEVPSSTTNNKWKKKDILKFLIFPGYLKIFLLPRYFLSGKKRIY